MNRLFLECTLRAALLVVGTAAALYFMRIRAAAARHSLWTATMLIMLALPIWTMWGPKLSLPVLPAPPSTNASYATSRATIFSATATPSPAVSTWQWALFGTYLFGFCLFAARIGIGTFRARRLVRQAAIDNGIRTSPSCIVPVALGFFRPVVVFPESYRQWSRSQFDAISAHEGEHVRRRDSLVQSMALLNRAVFWFHPVAWWLERTLGALAEEACDDAVLSRGHDPEEYAECLIDMARSVARSGFRVNPAGMAMSGGLLPKRIRKILEVDRAPGISRGRLACVVVICLMMCSAFTIGKLCPSRQGAVNRDAAAVSDCNADVKNSWIEKGYDAHVIIRAKVNSAQRGEWMDVRATPSYTYSTSDGTQLHHRGARVLIKIDTSATSEGEAVLEHPLDGCSSSEPCHLNNVSAKANISCSDE